MVEVFNAHVFHTKVINDEAKLDLSPFVAPETRSGSRFIVSFSFEVGAKKIVGQDTCYLLGEDHTIPGIFQSRSNRPDLYR